MNQLFRYRLDEGEPVVRCSGCRSIGTHLERPVGGSKKPREHLLRLAGHLIK